MSHHGYTYWTVPELRRMKQLAEAGMPCGSIAIALEVDFGVPRTSATVRCALRRHFNWSAGKPRPLSYGQPGAPK